MSGTRITHYEFSAGPGVIPKSVLETAQRNVVDFEGHGRSLMEMSHRGKIVTRVCDEAEADLRALLDIPDDYAVLFTQGGGTQQFSSVPLNLCGNGDKPTVDFVVTGTWSVKAAEEAHKYVHVHEVVNVKKQTGHYTSIPDEATWKKSSNAIYMHYTDNETIHGVEFPFVPQVNDAKTELVCDMSSNFLSRPVDVRKFGLIFAGAQKNCGIAGLTIVIVKKSLLGRQRNDIPIALSYKTLSEHQSMYNTPPVWSIYMAGLTFKWLKSCGGVAEMHRRAVERSAKLYALIDASQGFYRPLVAAAARSRMNITFRIRGDDEALEKRFAHEGEARGLHTLEGHRSVGGLRVSLFNAMPMEGVDALLTFMKEFQATHDTSATAKK